MKGDILICSKRLPDYIGGLASYQRLLGHLLREAGYRARYLALENGRANRLEKCVPIDLEAIQICGSGNLEFCDRLAGRPQAHGFMELYLQKVFSQHLKEAVSERPDIVHFVGTGWDYVGFPLATFARSAGAKFTVWPAIHPGSWGDDKIDLRLYRKATNVFCQSRFEADFLRDKGLSSERLIVTGLPPSSMPVGDGVRLRLKLEIAQRPTVFFLGRRCESKGYSALKRAFLKVIANIPEAVLVVAGPTDSLIDGERVDIPKDNFRDLGVIDEQTKADAYAACNIFCLPSAHESFGIVYVEAWSFGKPVICGSAPASRELVEHGVTGLWSDPNIPDTLADSISSLLQDSEKQRQLGDNGRRLQHRKYTALKTLQSHVEAWFKD